VTDVIKLFDDVSRASKGIDERLRETERKLKELEERVKGKEVAKYDNR